MGTSANAACTRSTTAHGLLQLRKSPQILDGDDGRHWLAVLLDNHPSLVPGDAGDHTRERILDIYSVQILQNGLVLARLRLTEKDG